MVATVPAFHLFTAHICCHHTRCRLRHYSAGRERKKNEKKKRAKTARLLSLLYRYNDISVLYRLSAVTFCISCCLASSLPNAFPPLQHASSAATLLWYGDLCLRCMLHTLLYLHPILLPLLPALPHSCRGWVLCGFVPGGRRQKRLYSVSAAVSLLDCACWAAPPFCNLRVCVRYRPLLSAPRLDVVTAARKRGKSIRCLLLRTFCCYHASSYPAASAIRSPWGSGLPPAWAGAPRGGAVRCYVRGGAGGLLLVSGSVWAGRLLHNLAPPSCMLPCLRSIFLSLTTCSGVAWLR